MPKGRVSRIDTDIEHSGRAKVIDYITKKYGAESVCRIVTFGTMAARMVLKDVARVLGYPTSWANSLAKLVPEEPGMTLVKALDKNPELKEKAANDPDVARVMEVATKLEGNKRHASQHACFAANTLVTTSDGLKRIIDVKPGDKVLTHKGRYKTVVDTMITETDIIYTVKCYGARPIEVTGNHPLLVRHQSTISKRTNGAKTRVRVLGNAEWKAVQDIEYDDYIGIPINCNSVVPKISNFPTQKEAFWWIIGRYIGDGWTEIYHRKEICPNHTERRIIICCDKMGDEGKEIYSKLDECGISYRIEEARTTMKVFISPDPSLYNYLQTFGRYAYGKHLNSDILSLPIHLAKGFLDGYMSADGSYIEESKTYSVKTVSEELAMGISLLVNKVYHVAAGYTFRPEHEDVIEGRRVRSKDQHVMHFIIEDRARKKYFYEDGLIWVRMRAITARNVEPTNMYNLTVLDDSSYQANGFAAHNCGLVIAPGSVSDYLPTSMEKDNETGDRSLTSQVTMTEVEALSLIKMDLLGLKNLTAIHEVIDTIKRTRGINTTYEDLPLDDRETYKMLSKGITGGVFQLEGGGMTNNVIIPMLSDVDTLPESQMHECFERLIAAVALYRPGPMDYIPNYIEGMKDPSTIHYLVPELEEILKPTYGVIVYQEQVMQIVQKLAGYSLGRADVVRKGMAKKKRNILGAEKLVFIHGNKEAYESGKDKNYAPGCVANGISEAIAEEIWAQMDKFASYAFNRSHAACYAWLASITAYMSCHWAPEFYCAMMNAFEDVGDKVKGYMALAVRRGIKILPPDINKSSDRCVVEDGCIRLGFHNLAFLDKFSHLMAKERKQNGPYADFQDFYERMTDFGKKPSKKVLESLIYSGALSSFGLSHNQMVSMIPMLEKDYKKSLANRQLGQFSMFTAAELKIQAPKVPEFSDQHLMEKEKEAIGFYLTRHPVDEFFASGQADDCTSITDLIAEDPGGARYICTAGIIKNLRTVYTKAKQEEMFLFTAEDRFNEVGCVLFPRNVAANKHRLMNGALVKIIGEFVVDDQRGAQIIVQSLTDTSSSNAGSLSSVTVTIHNKEEQEEIMKFARENPGTVVLKLLANGKTYPTNRAIRLTPAVMDFLQERFSKVEM